MVDRYIIETNYNTKESFLENKFLIFFYHLFKNIEFKDDTTYKISDKHIFTSFFEEMKESNKNILIYMMKLVMKLMKRIKNLMKKRNLH